ncbi:MAG: GNAT family N-acetyltransferase [Nannocystaceae bacterium]
MPCRIRFATAADADTLHRFICQLAEYEREPDAVEVTPQTLREQLSQSRPPFECLLAERTEPAPTVALGFALFFHNYSTWRGKPGLYLEDLFVPVEHRGDGVGAALLTALARLARQRGCARMEWSVLDWNAPAIGFYERLGARPMTGWSTYRLTDAPLEQLAASGQAIEPAR